MSTVGETGCPIGKNLTGWFVAKNTDDGSRKGSVKERIQAFNPVSGRYVKIYTQTGRIIDHKKSEGPNKGVRDASVVKKHK